MKDKIIRFGLIDLFIFIWLFYIFGNAFAGKIITVMDKGLDKMIVYLSN